ncbi:MAG: hypothetical protein WDA60_01695 [Acidimicrobiia bacterium]
MTIAHLPASVFPDLIAAAGAHTVAALADQGWRPSDLIDDPGFRQGVGAGIVALLVVLAAAVLVSRPRRWRDAVLPVAGIATVVATLVALDRTGPSVLSSRRLGVGLVLLLVGPFAAAIVLGRWRRSWPVAVATAVAAIPGGVVVARAASLQNHIGWVPALVFASAVIGGALVADFDDANARAGLSPVLLALAGLGMYVTVPDTEQTSVLVGVLLPLALLGWPVARARLGPGAYATVGLVAWAAAVGGRGRPGSVVGAIASLGVLLAEPIARRLWRGRARVPRRPTSGRALLMVALQLGIVVITSRVAGLETSGPAAAGISLVALALAVGGAAIVLAPRGSEEPRGRSPEREGRRVPNS